MKKRNGFTLVELLIVVTIISMMAAMTLGALSSVQEQGREYATKATIAKLNDIIMRRYESYMHRRVPVDLSGCTSSFAVAQDRLYAIRDLMRMEMPDRKEDIGVAASGPPVTLSNISTLPIVLPNSTKQVPAPSVTPLYRNYIKAHYKGDTAVASKAAFPAALLYMIVSIGNPEDMEQFTQSEIGDTDNDGLLEFLDGWGRPIYFLRWAPGYSAYSDIQVPHPSPTPDDPIGHHDPFDPRRTDSAAYQLFPLIYSSGAQSEPGLELKDGFSFNTTGGNIFGDSNFSDIGKPKNGYGVGNITNHHIESR